MTPCPACHVGPEDDCTDDCPTRTVYRGPGRPPIGPPLPVRLPPDLRAALDARAKVEGVKVTEVVRRACVAYLDEQQLLDEASAALASSVPHPVEVVDLT